MAIYLCQPEEDLKLGEIERNFVLMHDACAGMSIRQFEKRLAQDRRSQNRKKFKKLELPS